MYQKLLNMQNSTLWKFIHATDGILLSIWSILSIATIFATVVARYIFNTDIYGMEEIILVIAFWLYFIGGINGSQENSHIKADLVDVFIKNEVIVYTVKAIAKTVETISYAAFALWSINLVVLNLQRMPVTTGLKIPFVVSQFPIALGFIMMAVFAFYYALLFFFHAIDIQKRGK